MAENSEKVNKESGLEESEQVKKISGRGKIFLVTGMFLLQAVIAYLIVANYYSEVYKFINMITREDGLYYSIENLIINPADSRGERYLIASITIEMDNSQALTQIETQNAEVVDKINTLLSQRTVSQLNSISDRVEIKKEISMVINELLNQKSVRNLYFTKFVMQ